MSAIITLQGVTGGIDKTGMATLTAAFLAEDTSYEQALIAPLPVSGIGLPEDSRSIQHLINNNNFIINATFKGVVEKPGGQQSVNNHELSFEEEFVSKPIEAHPNIAALLAEYGGKRGADGKIVWPVDTPAPKSGTGLGSKAATGINEMYGMTTYQELHLVAVHSYTVKALPSDFRRKVGTIVTGLPALFKLANNTGKWLVRPSVAQGLGETGWKITDRYVDVTNSKGEQALRKLIVK